MSLQAYRKRAGLTQSALAGMVGVKRLSIARYEAGSRRPSPQVARKIATALRLTTDQIWEIFYGDWNDEEQYGQVARSLKEAE